MQLVEKQIPSAEPERHSLSRSFSMEQAQNNPQRCIERLTGFVKAEILKLGHDPNDYEIQLSRAVSVKLGTYKIKCEYWKVR